MFIVVAAAPSCCQSLLLFAGMLTNERRRVGGDAEDGPVLLVSVDSVCNCSDYGCLLSFSSAANIFVLNTMLKWD